MLKKLFILIASAIFIMPATIFAQDALPCGTDKMMKELMLRDPDYARQVKERRELIKSMADQPHPSERQQNTIVIPVVVHIIHDYNNGNISREQVEDAMRILNEDFNAGSSDLVNVAPAFQPVVGNVGIEFRLAKLDPSGNCTDGITRTYSPLTSAANDNVKNLIRWNPSKYLNIWVVKTISFGAGGYAYYPCPGQSIDGIVVAAGQFGSIGSSSGSTLFRSITHEVGHYLDLPHTWGDSNEPGLASNCSDDDGIADTPNTIGVSNFACNTNQVTCGSNDNVQNIMDYTSCQVMFTNGQKSRMLWALSLSCRSNLSEQSNLIATGTNNGYSATPCAAIVDFNSFTRVICAESTVHFQDLSHNAVPDTATWQWNWSFPGGTPSASTAQNPTVTYNTPGIYAVTLSVTTPGGTTVRTKNDFIEVRVLQSGISTPYGQGFEDAGFPVHPTDPARNWQLESSTSNTWVRTSAAAAEGIHSMRIMHQSIPSTRENSIITPSINFDNATQPRVKFKVAYAHSAGTGPDRLLVYYSSDCGQSWGLRFAKAGAALATAPVTSGTFIPNSSQWREETVVLPTGHPNMMLKFTSVSGSGSTIYLDDISFTGLVSGTEDILSEQGLQVFPNPGNGQATIKYELAQASECSLYIVNSIGQVVAKKEMAEQQGVQELDLQTIAGGKLSSGIYIVRLQVAGQSFNKKLIVN